MTSEQIQSLLPPIVLALGAILPFLIASPPFSVAANARVLLICLMTLVIWVGYWIAYLIGEWAFYSHWLTITLVGIALLVFGIIFYIAQKPASVGSSAEIDKPIWLWCYLIGLVLVSVAAALYVGPKDRVIVSLEVPPHDQRYPRITEVERDTGTGDMIALKANLVGKKNVAVLMLTQSELNSVKRFQLRVVDQDPNKPEYWLANKDNCFEELSPGLGKHVRIFAQKPQ